ncbi:SdpI family protein [Brevibacterium sp.]|uniref:SdpI family protein n=1 Tax=Brevibacterium sp. TaxID=1701 RepID=UPI002647C6AB|nr:SdpI family protein [Brevibacterium sp.]MDN5910045.1 SdpI family protein [Brevibacterium sp.]MDN6134000.1 SdpI family protein [Brevibacterium sp.]MDN6667713.1 SdpI family protein [Brevibacterium sp.]
MFYPPMAGYLLVTTVSVFLIFAQRRKVIGRNSAIGIRTRHTLASDAAWEAGHRAGVPCLYAMAVISTGHAVALFGAEISNATTVGHILSVLGWVLILICAVLTGKAANRAARSVGP